MLTLFAFKPYFAIKAQPMNNQRCKSETEISREGMRGWVFLLAPFFFA